MRRPPRTSDVIELASPTSFIEKLTMVPGPNCCPFLIPSTLIGREGRTHTRHITVKFDGRIVAWITHSPEPFFLNTAVFVS